MLKFKVLIFISFISIPTTLLQGQNWLGYELDTNHLIAKVDSFNMVAPNGNKIGSMILNTSFKDSQYIFHDISILDGYIREEATYKFEKKSMQLQSFDLIYNQGSFQINGHLDWIKEHAIGTYTILNKGTKRINNVDTTFTSGLIDRGEIFAFVQALPLRLGFKKTLKVLSQPSYEIWDMTLEVVGEEHLIVPAGTFETFKAELLGGKVSNVIYISKSTPRKIVKVEVVDQPIEILLITSKNEH